MGGMKNSNIGADYNLFVWGINQSGNWDLIIHQLHLFHHQLKYLADPTGILSTSVGNGGHNSVLKSDGTLWIWGSSLLEN